MFAQKDKFKLRIQDYRGVGNISLHQLAVLQEAYGLTFLELINIPGDKVLGLTDINPGKMNLNGEGRLLVGLMELFSIDFEELAQISRLLQ
jgi:hypothetical protein